MSRYRILFVDDEPAMRDIAVLSLRREPSFDVTACDSGERALEVAQDWTPDLILLDVVMPGLDGPATLARLRQAPASAAIPVVFLTARSRPEDVERLMHLGAAAVLPKPFKPHTLADAVRPFLVTP